jgi:hypothetical protein
LATKGFMYFWDRRAQFVVRSTGVGNARRQRNPTDAAMEPRPSESEEEQGLSTAGIAVDWWEVAARSVQFMVCGVPRCGDAGVDTQRRSVHSMRARWSMDRTFGEPLAGLPLPACVRCRVVPALLVARMLDFARREGMVPQRLPLHELCFKVGRLHLQKFRAAEPERYPCIALATADNPAGRRYRIVDGKHRIHRVILEAIRSGELEQDPGVAQPLSCSCVVFTVADVLASGALVVVPPCILPRNGGTHPTDQLDSGTVNCAAWLQENAAALGLPISLAFAAADTASTADDDPSARERRPLLGCER